MLRMNAIYRWAPALLVLIFVVSGCDTLATEEPVILTVEEEFDFEFNGNEVQAGQPILSVDNGDIGFQLGGLSKAEIVSAEVIEVELERGLPLDVNLNAIMTGATLRVQAGGQNSAVVGTLASAPADNNAEMTPGTANVGAHLAASTFQATLQVTPVGSISNDFHLLTATITFRVTLEGL
jgi:hypothetical protein